MVTDGERRWAAGAHLASIPGMALGLGFVGPLLVLWLRSGGSRMVRQHAVGAVNFNVTVGLLGLAGALATAALGEVDDGNGADWSAGAAVALVGAISTAVLARQRDGGGPDWPAGAAVALIVLLTVFWFLFTLRAAMTARYGEPCRYPFALPILRA